MLIYADLYKSIDSIEQVKYPHAVEVFFCSNKRLYSASTSLHTEEGYLEWYKIQNVAELISYDCLMVLLKRYYGYAIFEYSSGIPIEEQTPYLTEK
jgi:hypothetical protein